MESCSAASQATPLLPLHSGWFQGHVCVAASLCGICLLLFSAGDSATYFLTSSSSVPRHALPWSAPGSNPGPRHVSTAHRGATLQADYLPPATLRQIHSSRLLEIRDGSFWSRQETLLSLMGSLACAVWLLLRGRHLWARPQPSFSLAAHSGAKMEDRPQPRIDAGGDPCSSRPQVSGSVIIPSFPPPHQDQTGMPTALESPKDHSAFGTNCDPQLSEDEAPLAVLSKALGVGLPLGAVLIHGPAWTQLAREYAQLVAAASAEDLRAVTQFWLLFATTHPIVGPVLALAEVSSHLPGPTIAGTPLSALLISTGVLGTLVKFPNWRRVVVGALLAGFLQHIGAGVAGLGNLGDYNLAFNDGVRGCPTYEAVRQSSMDGFDLQKYQGRWYEVAFHDYTQYREVFDTTFDITLSSDGQRWVDDFTIKGPSPTLNPTSWDRSPVANGAHYFLYGKADPATPGVLQESGFGVVFPNYIVDVQRDASGKYTEAIQFQCLERGGVRVFEGINFLSRDPFISSEGLKQMHARAKDAGMYPYGASPEQMHYVEHRPAGPPVDNAAQRLWRFVGMDRLLSLLESGTHSALEDSVRN